MTDQPDIVVSGPGDEDVWLTTDMRFHQGMLLGMDDGEQTDVFHIELHARTLATVAETRQQVYVFTGPQLDWLAEQIRDLRSRG